MSVTLREGQQAWWAGVLVLLSCSTGKQPHGMLAVVVIPGGKQGDLFLLHGLVTRLSAASSVTMVSLL